VTKISNCFPQIKSTKKTKKQPTPMIGIVINCNSNKL